MTRALDPSTSTAPTPPLTSLAHSCLLSHTGPQRLRHRRKGTGDGLGAAYHAVAHARDARETRLQHAVEHINFTPGLALVKLVEEVERKLVQHVACHAASRRSFNMLLRVYAPCARTHKSGRARPHLFVES
jgi:hypothetical protein